MNINIACKYKIVKQKLLLNDNKLRDVLVLGALVDFSSDMKT
jgi:hypothetical protein